MVRVRELQKNEIKEALELVWTVFLKYEGPDYSEEGIEEFQKSIYDPAYLQMLKWYGAFDKNLVGVLATRNNGSHIAMFFVKGSYHRQGIGKSLFKKALESLREDNMTVNASPYAIEVYHHLGFVDTDTEQCTHGLRYTPMKWSK